MLISGAGEQCYWRAHAQQAATPAWQGQELLASTLLCTYVKRCSHWKCTVCIVLVLLRNAGKAQRQGKMTHVLIVHGNISGRNISGSKALQTLGSECVM